MSVWIVTGDGDALSIGGNHIIHMLRRNVDIKVLLFNNEIYGLTKGQYSPTSRVGLRTKATPFGSIDRPFNAMSLALGAGATFAARTLDNHRKHMETIIQQAAEHEGSAFVEIFQNCVIFNDGAFDDVADKAVRDDRTIDLRPGEPLVYGKELDKGLRLEEFEAEGCPADKATIWNPSSASAAPGLCLAELDRDPVLPTPIGVLRKIDVPTYDAQVHEQVASVRESKGAGDLAALIRGPETWEVE
jgi:2-oxoglutarate ferredoxin oxidoreductase subunit beta